jgi:hypothetical protein
LGVISRKFEKTIFDLAHPFQDFNNDVDDVLTCFGYWKDHEDLNDTNDNPYNSEDDDPYGARSPPGGGFEMDGYETSFFLGGSKKEKNPGPAVHTLNVFLRCTNKGGDEDADLDKRFATFCSDNHYDFRMACIRREGSAHFYIKS